MRQNGTAIKVIRELRGITVKSMSEQLGCDRRKVYRIENELTNASDETLQSIAGVLAVNVTAIRQREGTGDMTTTATKPRRRTVRAIAPDQDSKAELQHFTRSETAGLLSISPEYLYRLIKAEQIGYTVIAGSYKFTAAHIRAYSAQFEVKAKRAA